MSERLTQIRTDALAAEYIYTKKLGRLNLISIVSNCLTVLVPILFSGALLIAKGTSYESGLNIISVALGAILLSVVVLGFILKWEQAKENYLIGRRSNLYVANEALKLMGSQTTDLNWFFNYVSEMDTKDKENIGEASSGLKKEAYRDALMRLLPGRNDVVCAICNASPFTYKKGSCQICGNTPKG